VKIRRTFFTTRIGHIYNDYTDTNNYLFIILFDSGATLSFILRDLKENQNILNYIYSKLHKRFGNIGEIEISKITDVEYNLMKQEHIPSVIKVC
jgi:hypothetical protein